MKRKSQNEIVKSRTAKSNKMETLCTKEKPFKPKKDVNPKILFQYANDESFLKMADSELGIQFIQTKIKQFKQFARHVQLHHDPSIINEVLQGQALNTYMEKHAMIKSSEEHFRLQAMSVAKMYFDYKIPIFDDLYITEIKTRKIQCSNGMVYTLRDDSNFEKKQYTSFDFWKNPEFYCNISKQAADLAPILFVKIPIVPIVGKIIHFLYVTY
jgi:hypothetical protein